GVALLGGLMGPVSQTHIEFYGDLSLTAATTSTIYAGQHGGDRFRLFGDGTNYVAGGLSGTGDLDLDGGRGLYYVWGDNSAYSGTVTLAAGNGALFPQHANALGTGTVIVRDGGGTYRGMGLMANIGATVVVDPGGVLDSMGGLPVTTPIVMNGGTINAGGLYDKMPYGDSIFAGPITLQADGIFRVGFSYPLRLSGTISESGGARRVIIPAAGSYGSDYYRVHFSGTGLWTGGTLIEPGGVAWAETDNAMGTGTIDVQGRLIVGDSSGMPVIEVNGGALELRGTLEADVVFNSGVIQNTLGSLYGFSNGTLTGEVTMNGDVSLRTSGDTGRWLRLTGTLNDGANSYKILVDSGNGSTYLEGVGLYDGGTDVTQGRLLVDNKDALGTGSVYVGRNLGTANNQGGGSLVTRVDGCLDGLPSVIIDAGARFEVNSDETTLATINRAITWFEARTEGIYLELLILTASTLLPIPIPVIPLRQ
ncbi:hypothetical protein LCGC14_2484330, partial [marine sediment metagenome]